ncbi:MAG: hypothetical protein H6739_01080 [Alphaproteobacteria bacterium]|nr:hypothetical protein [Alphaproteobacteria bacterium]
MSLPTLTASRSLSAAQQQPFGAPGRAAAGLRPMMASGCLEGCVGTLADQYFTACGSDLICWRGKAPGAYPCVEACFKASASTT